MGLGVVLVGMFGFWLWWRRRLYERALHTKGGCEACGWWSGRSREMFCCVSIMFVGSFSLIDLHKDSCHCF